MRAIAFSILFLVARVSAQPSVYGQEYQQQTQVKSEGGSQLETKFLCGDATGDGKLATSDALFILKSSVEQTPCEQSVCDVDNNGAVNATDALKVLRAAVDNENRLVCPAPSLVPDDRRFNYLWGMQSIRAPEAWYFQTDCRDKIIAIIDSGIDNQIPDLAQQILINEKEIPNNRIDDDNNGLVDDIQGWNFAKNNNDVTDDWDHGTHIAGTIAAEGNNAIQLAGVCWRAKIIPLKFLNADGFGQISDAVDATYYAVKMKAKVINASWGGTQSSSSLKAAINYAAQNDVLMVTAAMNGGKDELGDDVEQNRIFPASFNLPNQITVAAININHQLADFSNFGLQSVHLAAPGVGIYSLVAGNSLSSWSGTSMATPHVAGAAALLWSKFPNLTMSQVREAIIQSARKIDSLTGKVMSGGTLDLAAAFAYVKENYNFIGAVESNLAVRKSRAETLANINTALTAARAAGTPTQPFNLASTKTIRFERLMGHKRPLVRVVQDIKTGEETKMVADHLMVKLNETMTQAPLRLKHFIKKFGGHIRKHSKLSGYYLVAFPVEGGWPVEQIQNELQILSFVDEVSPDFIIEGF